MMYLILLLYFSQALISEYICEIKFEPIRAEFLSKEPINKRG